MSSYMGDLGVYLNSSATTTPKTSTSRPNNTELSFTDMLSLMVVQLQNQTMDDTADTSQMLSQMIQMQVVQSITDITDATVMTYASSLVGKDVTIGTYNKKGQLEERVVTITGTGYSNGEQVLFAGNEIISLKDIMAVGRLPEIEEVKDTDKTEDSEKAEETEDVKNPDKTETEDGELPGDRPVGGTDETEQNNGSSEKGEDIVDPAAEAEQTT